MAGILQIGISRNTKCDNTVGFVKSGHIWHTAIPTQYCTILQDGFTKLNCMAIKLVLGGPSKRFAPDLPGCSIRSDFFKTTESMINEAGLPLVGKIIGQNGAEGHSGTTRVPLAQHLLA